jgi:hypothetical protein
VGITLAIPDFSGGPKAVSLPYLSSNKNIVALFSKIASAKIPPTFTHEFLQTTIGLKGTNDRPLIPLLRNLGFLDQASVPTNAYPLLKNNDRHAASIAAGVRHAYAPLFAADEEAWQLQGEKLKSLISQVAGTDADMSSRIAATFATLARLGDFKADVPKKEEREKKVEEPDDEGGVLKAKKSLRTEFHYNIQVHLPSSGSEETYINIFNAIRKTFQ